MAAEAAAEEKRFPVSQSAGFVARVETSFMSCSKSNVTLPGGPGAANIEK